MCRRCFKKVILKSFEKFAGNHMCQCLYNFINKETLRLATLLKRDSGAGVFL